MAAGADAGAAGGGASAAFGNLINDVVAAQQEGLQLQQGLNDAKREFDAKSAGLEMENAISGKISNIVSQMSQQIR
ncbi:MAG: hypothetical protein ACPGSM_05830 [Thiolinea sp.]